MSTDADAVDYSAEPSADVASGGFNFAGVEDAAQPDDGVQQMQEDDSNAAGDAQSAQAQGVCTLLSFFFALRRFVCMNPLQWSLVWRHEPALARHICVINLVVHLIMSLKSVLILKQRSCILAAHRLWQRRR